MSPYKHGKPVYKLSRKPLLIIALSVVLLGSIGFYLIFIRGQHNTIKNDNKPIIRQVKASATSTEVDEQVFNLSLPGKWTLSAKNWDARYISWQWTLKDKYGAGRLFEVFLDTIPTDKSVNYLLPVTSEGPSLQTGTISDNCVNFTEGASPTTERPTYTPQSKASIASKWQQISFICDNANVSHQVIGTGSKEGINTVTLTGPTKGAHKFYFLFIDNSLTPDFSLLPTILSSFQVK